ncbi:MAG: thiamine pyrophosphate-dependent dehydrogenase E1 component subunit alpha, partial [Candidatus Omnitrophica bacterium]|nr:thiamine pyrophosphate-dependent dehydrogenase E1 component subunit alpha [Candidatus Omnitrophota bacterium]
MAAYLYLSDMRPDFRPFEIDCGKITAYCYSGDLKGEVASGRLDAPQALALLEDMLMIRELEEMIVKLRSGAYEPLPSFNYRGPTHVSAGQEATSVGACSMFSLQDKITSTHRGHGDSLAKGNVALRAMTDDQLRARVPSAEARYREDLLEAAFEDHLYHTIAELFGKEDGYCKGRGGSMHIADFSIGHLGANAIVGGGAGIATGAALGLRYLRRDSVVGCFLGDGAFANGVVLEALNFAAQGQFTNELAGDHPYGLPIIFLAINNHYAMTGRSDNEVLGIGHLARRAAGFSDNNMHAEIVNGMDVLAVRDAVGRMAAICRQGRGPCFLEVNTYRYYGHSLSDPRNEYRSRDEEAAWRQVDPITSFQRQLLKSKVCGEDALEALSAKVKDRNAKAAVRAAA